MVDKKEIPITLKNLLEKYDFVKGLALVGSYARTEIYQSDEYSDMEMYIICDDTKLEEMKKLLPTVVSEIEEPVYHYNNRRTGFAAVFADLFRLELPVVKASEVSSVFNRPTAQIVKVLLDRTDGALQQALNSRPKEINLQEFFEDKHIDFWYMAIVGIQYFKKGEIYNSRSVLGILNSHLIKILELLNNPQVLALESNKRIERFLNKTQLDVLKRTSPSYEAESIRRAYMYIFEVFSKAINDVHNKYGYSYRREVEEQIRARIEELLVVNEEPAS